MVSQYSDQRHSNTICNNAEEAKSTLTHWYSNLSLSLFTPVYLFYPTYVIKQQWLNPPKKPLSI